MYVYGAALWWPERLKAPSEQEVILHNLYWERPEGILTNKVVYALATSSGGVRRGENQRAITPNFAPRPQSFLPPPLKFFRTQKILVRKKTLMKKKYLVPKNVGLKKKFRSTKKFWSKENISQTHFGPKKIW